VAGLADSAVPDGLDVDSHNSEAFGAEEAITLIETSMIAGAASCAGTRIRSTLQFHSLSIYRETVVHLEHARHLARAHFRNLAIGRAAWLMGSMQAAISEPGSA
jgi:hypothetical protein